MPLRVLGIVRHIAEAVHVESRIRALQGLLAVPARSDERVESSEGAEVPEALRAH